MSVARAFEGKIQVVMSDEVEYIEELVELGLNDRGDDVVIALWAGMKEKYILKEEFDEYSLNDFIEVCTVI